MNVTNLTSLYSNGTVKFNYSFRLNTDESFDTSLLPYFIIEVYTNLTNRVITSFDARFDRIFDVTLDIGGNINYTFITDNEVQNLNGITTLPKPTPEPTPNPIGPNDEPNNKTNNSNNNSKIASASMKRTGMLIIVVLLRLLSSLGLISRKK